MIPVCVEKRVKQNHGASRPRFSVCREALEDAQHDRAYKGEREIGGHDAHAAGESHVTTPLVPRNAAGSQPNAAGSQPVPGVPLCAAATSLKMTEHNALKKP
jgi:hypothetical protein